MNKKSARIVSAIIVFTLFSGISSSFAAWRPLVPGDHVIDSQRLQDSIRVTAQKIAEYQSRIEQLKNKILLSSGIKGLEDRISAAIDDYSKTLDGRSLIFNPLALLSDSIFRTPATDDQIIKPSESNYFQKERLTETMYANQDALQRYQYTAGLSGKRLETAADILSTDTSGIVGTIQQSAALSSLAAINENDETRMIAADVIRQIEADEQEYAQERLEREITQLGMFYEYDPYEDSAYEKASAKSFGFLSTRDLGNK